MAPQNSTLIHENFELTSELSRYSPILPLTMEKERNVDQQKKSICSSTEFIVQVHIINKKNIIYIYILLRTIRYTQ